jgi:cytochrome c oxidase subunit 2
LNDHNTKLEVFWSIIPVFLIGYVFFWSFNTFLKMKNAPSDAYEIHAKGKMWLWEFNYDNGTKVLNELHVPAGKPVRMVMSSEDVIHSFYIPDFRVKHDVVPNRYTSVWFEAIKSESAAADTSWIFCTEYCGSGHSNMIAKVIVHEPKEFEKWLKESGGRPADMPLAEYGQKLYTSSGCQTCHSLDGNKLVGPSFKGLFGSDRAFADGSSVQADEQYIRESILNPTAKVVASYQPVMPTYQGVLGEEEIDAIVEFIKEQK